MGRFFEFTSCADWLKKRIFLSLLTSNRSQLWVENEDGMKRVALLAHNWGHGLVDLKLLFIWMFPGLWSGFVSCWAVGFLSHLPTQERATSRTGILKFLFHGVKEPVAECFFSGPVQNASAEIQCELEGIAVALSFNHGEIVTPLTV